MNGAKAAICTPCHGDIVDDPLGCAPQAAGSCSDTDKACATDADCAAPATCDLVACDHRIPTYTPSLVTPEPAGGEEGTCDFCHDAGLNTIGSC